jgi:hypothetical protein
MPAQFAHGLGWLPDVPDIRDIPFAIAPQLEAAIPTSVDLRNAAWSPAFDQGTTNSCTGHAVAFLFESLHVRLHDGEFIPSPAFIYWNARVPDGTTTVDKGAFIRHGMRGVNVFGTCSRGAWPLERGVLVEPEISCFGTAIDHKATEYRRIGRDLDLFRGCLAQGTPFVFGFSVYESIASAETTGEISLPRSNDKLVGGHAVAAVGYHDASQRFLIRNSWGSWGNAGYGTLPYAYLTNADLSDDFWTMTSVTAA